MTELKNIVIVIVLSLFTLWAVAMGITAASYKGECQTVCETHNFTKGLALMPVMPPVLHCSCSMAPVQVPLPRQ